MQNQVDFKTVQSLLKTKIPLKRNFTQREKKTTDEGSDLEPGKDSDYGSETELLTGDPTKRLNDGGGGVEITNIELSSQITNAMEASKNLPIAKHKQAIINKIERNKVVIISGDTGCGKTT